MAKIKKGDTVQVMTGESSGKKTGSEQERGKRGVVQSVDLKTGRLVITGVNVIKKHQKPVQAGRGKTQAGIIEFEAPINLSNVLLVCPKCNEPTRVGVRVDGDSKVRVCKHCGADIA